MLKLKQVEVRFMVDQGFIEKLRERLGGTTNSDLARSAFTLLDWASTETHGGRLVLSSNEDGKDVHRLVMPELVKLPELV